MKEIATKKIGIIESLLNHKIVEEKIDVPLKREKLTPKGHRKGCNCGRK